MDTKSSQTNMPYRFSIIGAGKVAKALADKLQELALLDFVYYKNPFREQELLDFGINSNNITNKIEDIFKSDIIIISVNDNAILDVVETISKNIDIFPKSKLLFHTSGLISAKVLSPLINKGYNVFSAHPIQTFFYPRQSLLKNITWGIENLNADAIQIKRIIELFDGKAMYLPEQLIENRALYHLICVISSNFVTTTIEYAKLIANHLEIQDISFLSELIKTTTDNCLRNLNSLNTPLTGPLARKDFDAINRYFSEIAKNVPLKKILVSHLIANIDLMKEKKLYDQSEEDKIKKIIEKYQ